MDRGYTKLWRKIVDNEMITNADACQMFLFLMGKSTHRPHKIMVSGQVIVLQPGEFFAGRKQLALALKSTEQRVRTALKNLEKCGIINQQSTTKGTLISLINWDKYQGDQPAVNQESNQRLTSGQPALNQRLTTKQEDITHSTEEEEYTPPPRARAKDPEPVETGQAPTRADAARLFKTVRDAFTEIWPEAAGTASVCTEDIMIALAEHLAADPQRAGPEFWRTAAVRARASSCLRGEAPGKNGKRFSGMKFGWFVKPNTVGRILNGDFDDAPPPRARDAPPPVDPEDDDPVKSF